MAIGLLLLMSLVVLWLVETRRGPEEEFEVDLDTATPEVRLVINEAMVRVRREPGSGEAWGELAMRLRAHGFELLADQAFERAERLAPEEFRWPYLLGVSLENVEPGRAEASLRRAIQLKPDLALPRLTLAEMLVGSDRVSEAERLFEEARSLEPDNTRALLGLARVKLDAGDAGEAERLCRRVTHIEPGSRMALELLAQVLFRRDERQEAESIRRRLETMPQIETSEDPFVAEVLVLRQDPNWIAVKAQTMIEQGQADRAIAYLKKVMADHPGRVRFPLQLARALGGIGRAKQSRQVLLQAVIDFPDSAELRLVLGLVQGELKNFESAVSSFDAAIARKPDYAEAWLWRGRALRDAGNLDEAISSFRQVVRYRPDMADGHGELGAMLLVVGRAREAADSLATAVDLAPGHGTWMRRLSEARRTAD
tara:strand:- start:1113 stop:2390 length:1278 start_codon:yes stop_codon:yes gene_type:complete